VHWWSLPGSLAATGTQLQLFDTTGADACALSQVYWVTIPAAHIGVPLLTSYVKRHVGPPATAVLQHAAWVLTRSTSTTHDDPVSAARRHALRAVDQRHSLRGSGFVAADQPQQSLGVAGSAQQAEVQEQGQQQGQQAAMGVTVNLRTLVLYIFSPTDPGDMLPKLSCAGEAP
jgi:hypothetical protein